MITGISYFSFRGMDTIPGSTGISGKSLRISGGLYDCLYSSSSLTDTAKNEADWEETTILHAKFNDDLYAGNVNFGIDNTTNVLVKRREKGTFKWLPIFDIPVLGDIKNLDVDVVDRYARCNTDYEYAIVPIINGKEGSYNIGVIRSEFDGLHLIDPTGACHSAFRSEWQITKNRPSVKTASLGSKYQYVLYNSKNNFYTGTITTTFVKTNPELCTIPEPETLDYSMEVMEFLTNGRTKILKLENGQIYMVEIGDNPSLSATEHPFLPETAFDWMQVGDCESNEDLYNFGLSDLGYEWWVS